MGVNEMDAQRRDLAQLGHKTGKGRANPGLGFAVLLTKFFFA